MASVLAIDWSGALAGVRRKLWIAEVQGGRLVRLERGRDRDGVVRDVLRAAERDAELTVGLDFCFSFPLWFLAELGTSGGSETWSRVARDGERWLATCPPPFFGRLGTRRPVGLEGARLYRATESALLPIGGALPKSVFQLAGNGHVGTGSLRGMPYLLELERAGFRIWPFSGRARRSGGPRALELYPRMLTGPVVKSDPNARRLYLRKYYPDLGGELRTLAENSDDAFDAAVSALRLAEHAEALADLPEPTALEREEGAIWVPPAVLRPLTRRSLERGHPAAP